MLNDKRLLWIAGFCHIMCVVQKRFYTNCLASHGHRLPFPEAEAPPSLRPPQPSLSAHYLGECYSTKFPTNHSDRLSKRADACSRPIVPDSGMVTAIYFISPAGPVVPC